jgi:AGZA family xanthine/uracil permease-like MFS transporter
MPSALTAALERRFHLDAHGTDVRREAMAGLTTFLTMAYISVVNPAILSEAGMDFGAVFVATCLAAAFGSIAMGILGNYPIALAPGMGQNAFFAYVVVLGLGFTWQQALGAVFWSGVLFIALSLVPLREWLINAIPKGLKLGIASGVGLFLGFIALQNAQVVVANEATLVTRGDLLSAGPLLALLGFVVMVALAARRVTGAVIIGMLAATAVSWLLGVAEFHGVLSLPPSAAPVFLQADLRGSLDADLITIIITLLIVDVFDSAGTLVGVANRAGLLTADGKLPQLRGAMLADSTATTVGALVGTSSTTTYIESAAGVEAGGRTGLAAVVTGLLFLGCLFFAPLAQSVPAWASAAALLFVACLMAHALVEVDWDDLTEGAPAVLTALAMPFTFSIADGIGVGFIAYVLIKVGAGRWREVPPAVVVVAAVFAGKFAFL